MTVVAEPIATSAADIIRRLAATGFAPSEILATPAPKPLAFGFTHIRREAAMRFSLP